MKWYEKQKEMYVKKEQEATLNTEPIPQSNVTPEDSESTNEVESIRTDFQNTASYSNYFDTETEGSTTCISKKTILHGKIETEDALEIHGAIEGDVVCESKLEVTGRIKGNIQCDTAEMEEAEILGDIICRNSIKLSSQTIIEGNIQTDELLCGGKIKGDIQASGGVTFTAQSCVIGNVIARDIEINRGAVIQGTIQIEPTEQ